MTSEAIKDRSENNIKTENFDPRSKEDFLDYLNSLERNYDLEAIGKAYDTASEMHNGQLRKSGEPYIIHPVETAKILAELGMDDQTIIAGLLHDVVEDTSYSEEDLKNNFGDEIALLVEGVTKLGSLVFETKEEAQAENMRKMFLAMSKDIRVLIIKLADRLHNMRTIDYMPPEKIKEKCTETLDIYAPLADRLGMFQMKFELEDIALKHLKPEFYANLAKQIHQRKEQREENIREIIEQLKVQLDTLGIHYEVYGRSKHFYSIYRKMRDKHKQLDEIFDLLAIRVLVDSVKDCYAVLGIVHTLWKPVPGRFKDYIAMPKSNMYQSLHTTVFGTNGQPFEIQIRTYEMHRIAEYGIAAHWKYKEGIKSDQEEGKLAWLRQTLEWNQEAGNANEFMETLKVDLFSNQVFVFTPAGKVIELPAGSTPIDFAYKIHSNVGNQCIGAKVNGKMVTLDHMLENGNIVEIITSPNSKGPNVDWLKIAKSRNARNKIRQWLKKENKNENVEKGKSALEKYVRRKRYDPAQILRPQRMNKVAKELNFQSTDDMYSSIGYGGTMLSRVLDLLLKSYEDEKNAETKARKEIKNFESKTANRRTSYSGGVKVKGMDNLLTRLAKCCNPVPGDDIIGFITKGRGVTVHRTDCPNITSLPEEEKSRFIEVEWGDIESTPHTFETDISVLAEDRKGMFADLSKICEDMDVHITGVNGRSNNDNTASITLTIQITNVNQIKRMMSRFRALRGVIEVKRGNANYN
ncbi:MAG: bifunctional (p)ppGpp synthetase/guanosine-3',5'-bis(diphosphate) 3'-pyrophosphohydrolase [Eubacteriales bacterium]|nr:bifunctional (p)ppGpp synthetase/guanosine-3',5'-bis(diphosphate) 3'-pyrophosphohydrolase [Eubacteriales bacterium]